MGSFTFIYKFVLNSLPLLSIPEQLAVLRLIPRRTSSAETPITPSSANTSSTNTSSAGYNVTSKVIDDNDLEEGHLSAKAKTNYSRLHVSRWHAVVAGALAGPSFARASRSCMKAIFRGVFPCKEELSRSYGH